MGKLGRILVVDDDQDTADMFGEMLRRDGYDVIVAYSAAQALQLVEGVDDLAVAMFDLAMVGLSGCDLAELLARRARSPQLIALSGVHNPPPCPVELHGRLVKPSSVAEVRAAVDAAWSRWHEA